MMMSMKTSQSVLLLVFGMSIISLQTLMKRSVYESFYLNPSNNESLDGLSLSTSYREQRSMQATSSSMMQQEPIYEKKSFEPKLHISSQAHKKEDEVPGVVWLASYPNSGTSYTLEIVRRASDYAIATNYGKEASKHLSEASIPIHPSFINGPYRTNDRTREVPEKFVLTKTHCGSRCVRCSPYEYVETEESFLERCLSAQPLLTSTSGQVAVGEIAPYSADLVKRAVHIMRDPFDNIVSRFHHAHKTHKNDPRFQSNFPRNNIGFQAWCDDLDSKYNEEEQEMWDNDVYEVSRDVPCRSEFFRYVQWHDMAFITMKNMDIPTLFLSYEDYAHHIDFNILSILDFLELPMRNKVSEFHQGDYSAYYSDDQRVAAMAMMSKQASSITWEKMKPYSYKVKHQNEETDLE